MLDPGQEPIGSCPGRLTKKVAQRVSPLKNVLKIIFFVFSDDCGSKQEKNLCLADPFEGLAVCRAKAEPLYLSYFKTLRIGSGPRRSNT